MCVAIKADGVPLRQMWVPRKALGRREANGVPKGTCVAIKADGVPLRQMWAPKKALGRREANGAPKGMCGRRKANGVPKRQMWVPKGKWGSYNQRRLDGSQNQRDLFEGDLMNYTLE